MRYVTVERYSVAGSMFQYFTVEINNPKEVMVIIQRVSTYVMEENAVRRHHRLALHRSPYGVKYCWNVCMAVCSCAINHFVLALNRVREGIE
jgi:hypothetical protein